MRLSANILQSAEQRTNPLGEREILLRSLAIPAIEHLAVTRDQFDAIDMSNNHLSRLENFPRLERLSCLYLGGNGIDFVDGKNLRRNVPGLKTLILSGNGVRGWNVIADLGAGCPKLEFLSLVGNPVTSKSVLCRFVWIVWGDRREEYSSNCFIPILMSRTHIFSFCSLFRDVNVFADFVNDFSIRERDYQIS
jgi:U2 small nuclear ribonucleoprotein A'